MLVCACVCVCVVHICEFEKEKRSEGCGVIRKEEGAARKCKVEMGEITDTRDSGIRKQEEVQLCSAFCFSFLHVMKDTLKHLVLS